MANDAWRDAGRVSSPCRGSRRTSTLSVRPGPARGNAQSFRSSSLMNRATKLWCPGDATRSNKVCRRLTRTGEVWRPNSSSVSPDVWPCTSSLSGGGVSWPFMDSPSGGTGTGGCAGPTLGVAAALLVGVSRLALSSPAVTSSVSTVPSFDESSSTEVSCNARPGLERRTRRFFTTVTRRDFTLGCAWGVPSAVVVATVSTAPDDDSGRGLAGASCRMTVNQSSPYSFFAFSRFDAPGANVWPGGTAPSSVIPTAPSWIVADSVATSRLSGGTTSAATTVVGQRCGVRNGEIGGGVLGSTCSFACASRIWSYRDAWMSTPVLNNSLFTNTSLPRRRFRENICTASLVTYASALASGVIPTGIRSKLPFMSNDVKLGHAETTSSISVHWLRQFEFTARCCRSISTRTAGGMT
eukprot:PhM_4_TR12833/c0_g1_i1/m.5150